MTTTTRGFQLTETVNIYAEVKDQDDAYVTPTSITVTITLPDGTSGLVATDMTAEDTGKYNYYYNSVTQTGWYKVRITVTDATKVTIKDSGFTVT